MEGHGVRRRVRVRAQAAEVRGERTRKPNTHVLQGTSSYLDHPPNTLRHQVVVNHPSGKLAPLGAGSAIDRQAVLGEAVLGLLQVLEHFLGDFCKELALTNKNRKKRDTHKVSEA